MAGDDESGEFVEFGSESSQSGSFVQESKTTKNKYMRRASLDEDYFLNLLHGSDPVKIELNRLQNELTDKDRELLEAQNEIKALRLIERSKDKALAEVTEELGRMVEKLQTLEAAVENKNLEIKKILEEKKAAMTAQFAAEATLRRVHAAQKDEELPSLEAILTPLEAEIKLLRQETSKLQENKRVLERLTKSKEAALLEAAKEIQIAKLKASVVDDLQNRNQDLIKQVDISQEEYAILDKMHRQKVAEVEKLGQTVRDLEEALLSGAASANSVRDYQRQVNELRGEKKTLERTLSRTKVTENRVAVVVANEWKDANDKVMPVKQWLEERRVLTGEVQQLREKLGKAERTAKTEAQLKEKLLTRLKVIEEGLKSSVSSGTLYSDLQSSSSRITGCHSVSGTVIPLKIPSTGATVGKSPASPVRTLTISSPSTRMLKHAKGVSKSFSAARLLDEDQCETSSFGEVFRDKCLRDEQEMFPLSSTSVDSDNKPAHTEQSDPVKAEHSEFVSSVLYDFLQKEVINLRKMCHEKDQTLKDRENAIENLSKKVDTLTKAMEVEAKKMRREKAAMEKEVASRRVDKEHEQKAKRLTGSKGLVPPMPSGRSSRNA